MFIFSLLWFLVVYVIIALMMGIVCLVFSKNRLVDKFAPSVLFQLTAIVISLYITYRGHLILYRLLKSVIDFIINIF